MWLRVLAMTWGCHHRAVRSVRGDCCFVVRYLSHGSADICKEGLDWGRAGALAPFSVFVGLPTLFFSTFFLEIVSYQYTNCTLKF